MRLVVATEEEKRSRDPLTHQAWGQRLTVAEFCARELRLRAHPWCRESMRTWLWKDADGAILASCETFRMCSFLEGRPSISFGVASVFTEPALRGKGHALAMMRALGERLREEEPHAHGVMLFSEVGATLYGRAGYEARSFHDRLLPAQQGAIAADWIGEGAIAAALATFPLPRERFSIWPTAAQIDWHLERERIYAELAGRKRPSACGVVMGEARALWAADFKNDRLAVLLATAPDEGAGAALLRAASQIAAEAGLAGVRVWETPSCPLPAALGERIPRDDDALPMLLPLAADLSAGDWEDVPRALWV